MQLTDSEHPHEAEILTSELYYKERLLSGCRHLFDLLSTKSRTRQSSRYVPSSRRMPQPKTVEDVFMMGLIEGLKRMPSAIPEEFVIDEDFAREHVQFDSIHGSFFKENIRYTADITLGTNAENVGLLFIDIHGPSYLDKYMITMPRSIRVTAHGEFLVHYAWGYPVWKKAVEIVTSNTDCQPDRGEVVFRTSESYTGKEKRSFDELFDAALGVLEDIAARAI